MPAPTHLLAIDQGTTSTRAIVFAADGTSLASAQVALRQIYPRPGWVEHDPEEIWQATLAVARGALARAKLAPSRIAAIGLTNQRETTILWDRETGAPIYNALCWQDRRTADWCRAQSATLGDAELGRRTGLLFDAYFSASKIVWLLDHVAGARRAAEAGRLAFGTIDTFLLWRLTGGRRHLTDATNASRTMLFNLETQDWDDDLLAAFGIPRALLPELRDSVADYGTTAPELFDGAMPITGIAGDQHAGLIGQACFAPGMVKSTYGTGCFAMLNTGATRVASRHRLLTTLAYRIGGQPTYALEGSIFSAGAALQWLRDGLGLIADAGDSASLAGGIDGTGGVYFVPAFTGLGAPHWDPDARAAILGVSRGTGAAQLVRAALESVAYQTRDLIDAMEKDWRTAPTALRVDGGMAANDWVMQFLADLLAIEVRRPAITETTARGAAFLAGLGAGLYASTADIARLWTCDRVFAPAMEGARREVLYAGWSDAVRRVLRREE
jgi:glycerol kinase